MLRSLIAVPSHCQAGGIGGAIPDRCWWKRTQKSWGNGLFFAVCDRSVLLRLMRQTAITRHLPTLKAKLMARVGEEFPLECPGCGGVIGLIAFITDPGPVTKRLPAGAGPRRTGGSQAGEGQDGFARVQRDEKRRQPPKIEKLASCPDLVAGTI